MLAKFSGAEFERTVLPSLEKGNFVLYSSTPYRGCVKLEVSCRSRATTTSFPGLSPTHPTERRAGRKEPWERGWCNDSLPRRS